MQKILHPIVLDRVNQNSFQRIFWPHGTHHSLKRILNSTVEAKTRSSKKAENPLLTQRLMKYCEVSLFANESFGVLWAGFLDRNSESKRSFLGEFGNDR